MRSCAMDLTQLLTSNRQTIDIHQIEDPISKAPLDITEEEFSSCELLQGGFTILL